MLVDAASTLDQLQAAADDQTSGRPSTGTVRALSDFPAVAVSAEQANGISNGRRYETAVLDIAPGMSGLVRVISPDGTLLAVSTVDQGRVVPEVVVPQ